MASQQPGFYVAHHRWLDVEHGPDALYKVGHTGDLRRRLEDSAYVTCFPTGWRFVLTVETASKLEAQRLEAGVLECLAPRRVRRDNNVLSELAMASRAEIGDLVKAVADRLGVVGQRRDDPPPYPPPQRGGAAPATDDPSGAAPAEAGVLTPYERSGLRALRLAADDTSRSRTALDDLVSDLTDDFADLVLGGSELDASSAAPVISSAAPAVAAPKSAADYLREARERAAAAAPAATVAASDDDDLMFEAGAGAPDALEDLIASFDAYDVQAARFVAEAREYQADAVRACLAELARKPAGVPGRAVLQMACRCGKTRVAYGVLQDYFKTPRGAGRPRVLYLVPGLALLRQTAQKLDLYGFADGTELLLVGSDDRPVPDLRTLRAPAGTPAAGTTDPALIRRVCGAGQGAPLLVVSTYQSSGLVPDGFDLVVFDESHRTCGDRRARPFTHVLLNHAAGDRLYMTATPRYDAPVSMKDRALYGGVAYAYHMRQGIDAGYVNSFSVELVGRAAAGAASPLADAAQIVAAVDSLNATCGDAGKLLVFCRDIRHADQLRRETAAALAARGGVPVTCLSAHSRMARADIAAALSAFCAPGASAVLFNCRLFQEGVEIPALNGVFFAAPRHSPRDIIQSLCRPLNAVPGKPPSKIFIPVAVDPAAAPDSAANLERFATIVPYFDALVAEDPLLYEHLLDPRGTPYPLGWVDSAVKGLRYTPESILGAARRSVRRGGNGKTERLLRASRIPWEIGFAELRRIVTECGRYPKTTDCFTYGDAKVNFGQFYRYARESYAAWRAGEAQPLEPHQLRELEGLPGWDPYGIEGPYPWRRTLEFLEKWLREHDGELPWVEINKGGYVGLEASEMERLSGTLTCINQSDGRDRTAKDGSVRPGSGFTLEASKQKDLDALCARWGLRWRKERHPPPEGAPKGAVGSLVENDQGEYAGAKTFIQEAYSRFKAEWAARGKESEYINTWFRGYPSKHHHQENDEVWARRKAVVPPRWRGRGRAANTPFDAKKTIYM